MRLGDHIYLKSNRYNKPKEKFKFLYNILKRKILINKSYDLLDIGCANGELIYFLKKKFNNINFSGACIRNDLLEIAKKKKF